MMYAGLCGIKLIQQSSLEDIHEFNITEATRPCDSNVRYQQTDNSEIKGGRDPSMFLIIHTTL